MVTVADAFQIAICKGSRRSPALYRSERGSAVLDAKKVTKINKVLAKGKLVVLGALVGILLGVGGTIFFQNYNPPDEDKGAAATAVFGRFVEQAELVGVSQDYCIVDKYPDVETFFDLFDLPWTANSVWYRYAGTLKAGVNMDTAEMWPEGTVIHVTLDQPYIISNTPNMDISGVLKRTTTFLTPFMWRMSMRFSASASASARRMPLREDCSKRPRFKLKATSPRSSSQRWAMSIR